MKIKYLALFLSMFYINLKSQDKIDPSPLQNIDTVASIRTNGSQKFLLSWNWGSPGKALDEALKMNSFIKY